MNKYYKVNTSQLYVAVRQNGVPYPAPGELVKANRALKELARIRCIPTLFPINNSKFIQL